MKDGSLANLKSVAIITALFAVFRKKQYRDTVLLMLKECAKWWLNRYRAGARNFRKDHPTISRSVGVGVAVLETTGSYALSVSLAVMALVVFYLTIPLAVQTARQFRSGGCDIHSSRWIAVVLVRSRTMEKKEIEPTKAPPPFLETRPISVVLFGHSRLRSSEYPRWNQQAKRPATFQPEESRLRSSEAG